MLTVRVTIVRGKDVPGRIRKLGQGLSDLTGAMKDIGKSLGKYYASTAFASQGAVYGQQWPALSPAYAVWKAKHYPGAGMLIQKGTMQKSYVSTSTRSSVLVTNSDPKFKYHQSTEGPRTRIPRRATIGVNGEVEDIVRDILTAEIQERTRKI